MKRQYLFVVAMLALLMISSVHAETCETYSWFGIMKPPGCDIREKGKTCVIDEVCCELVAGPHINPGVNVDVVGVNYSSAVALSAHSFMALPLDAHPAPGVTIVRVFYTDDGSDAIVVR